jgi:hypothetical protein
LFILQCENKSGFISFLLDLTGSDFEDAEDDDCDHLSLLNTAIENGRHFGDIFKTCGGQVPTFLKRDIYVPVRGTTACLTEQDLSLKFTQDVDGVVIEWKRLTGLQQSISHLQILPKGNVGYKLLYPVIKKHLNLTKYTPTAREVLRDCIACQLCYTDGWETWLGVIPDSFCTARYPKELIRSITIQTLRKVKNNFERNMKDCVANKIALDTVAKNNLNDLSRIFILPDDKDIVVDMFQVALDDTTVAHGDFKKMLITFRFGDKFKSTMQLPIGQKEAVLRVSAHIGLCISASYDNPRGGDTPIEAALFWCRQGLQDIVGSRGTLTSAFSFMECANYQTNLDGRHLSISGDLRNISRYPDRINFMQMYCDLPHRYPKARMHPVSGAILLADGLYKNRSSVDADALTYLSETENNFNNLAMCRSRLEIVVVLPDVQTSIDPSTLMIINNVHQLLQKHALLAPFLHRHFTNTLRSIGQYLVSDLKSQLISSKGTSNSLAVWQAYQDEIAIEKLLWGRPLCFKSQQFAINLGPGVAYPSRSTTDAMGFLCLEESTACCVDEFTTPPLTVYSGSICVQNQLKKLFGFHDILRGSAVTVGRAVVTILLRDMFDIGHVFCPFAEFFGRLKASTHEGIRQVVGGITRKQLVELLLSAKKVKYPMVGACVFAMLRNNDVDIAETLDAGIRDLQLGYFPAVRLHDQQRHPCLYWHWRYGLWAITDIPDSEDSGLRRSSIVTSLVINELEKRKLCYTSKLETRTFPWITPCIDKLSPKALGNDALVIVLTFVSCMALLMQGKYVDYARLSRLVSDMPIHQSELKVMGIQSRFLFGYFPKYRLSLWRIHNLIPLKSDVQQKSITTQTKDDFSKLSDETNDPAPIDELISPNHISETPANEGARVQVVPIKHIPNSNRRNWSPVELGILGDIRTNYREVSQREQYKVYTKQCGALGIPDRSFVAFKLKMKRCRD